MQEKSNIISTINSSCFIDTGVFFGAYNRNDEVHSGAALLLISAILGWFGRAYTSTYVIDETLTLAKVKLGGQEAVRLAESILGSKRIIKVNVDEDHSFQDSLERFKKYRKVRGLSFTDCSTLVLRDRMKIDVLLSFDRGFKPFVTRLLGERYEAILSQEQHVFLTKVADTLGVKLKPRER